MNYKRTKNNIIITVKKWASEVTLTDATTKEVLQVAKFNDHVHAILAAQAL